MAYAFNPFTDELDYYQPVPAGAYAWAFSGSDIYNNNASNVLIGTSTDDGSGSILQVSGTVSSTTAIKVQDYTGGYPHNYFVAQLSGSYAPSMEFWTDDGLGGSARRIAYAYDAVAKIGLFYSDDFAGGVGLIDSGNIYSQTEGVHIGAFIGSDATLVVPYNSGAWGQVQVNGNTFITGNTYFGNSGAYINGSSASLDLFSPADVFVNLGTPGNLIVNGTSTANGNIYAGSLSSVSYGGLAADILNRKLYAQDGTTLILAWDSPDFLYGGNSSPNGTLNLATGILGNYSSSNFTSIDFVNRTLYASDGTSPVLNWGSGAYFPNPVTMGTTSPYSAELTVSPNGNTYAITTEGSILVNPTGTNQVTLGDDVGGYAINATGDVQVNGTAYLGGGSGIGMANPYPLVYALAIGGDFLSVPSYNDVNGMEMWADGGPSSAWWMGSHNSYQGISGADFIFTRYNTSIGNWLEAMRWVNSNGNILIGTSSDVGARLNVDGTGQTYAINATGSGIITPPSSATYGFTVGANSYFNPVGQTFPLFVGTQDTGLYQNLAQFDTYDSHTVAGFGLSVTNGDIGDAWYNEFVQIRVNGANFGYGSSYPSLFSSSDSSGEVTFNVQGSHVKEFCIGSYDGVPTSFYHGAYLDGSFGYNSFAFTVNPLNSGTIGGLKVFGTANLDGATASTIAGFDSSKNLVTLATATYPSLTELSYVKGVTSALQTQINAKGAGTVTSVASGSGLSGGTITGSGTLSLDLTHANTFTGQQIFNTTAPQVGTATSSTITSFDASKNLVSLATATYPSLTELSYVKGVTSAIQTQLGNVGTTLVATASPSAVANFTISSLSVGKYKLIYNFIQNTSASTMRITFNGDSGANYKYMTIQYYPSTIYTGGGSNSANYISPNAAIQSPDVGTVSQLELTFSTNGNIVSVSGQNEQIGGSAINGQNFTGQYSGSTTLSSITLTTGAGTMTGTASLYKLN